jgi:dihydroflavonol-4-reductase
MNIVTGATGFIGNVLVRQLCGKGEHVTAFTRSDSDMSSLEGCEYKRVIGNILDPESLIRAFRGTNTVFHLASEITILPGPNKRLKEINIQGTRNVLKACFECKVKKLVYTSSIHAFKETDESTVVDESVPFDPSSPMGLYNRSKAMASIEVLKAAKEGLNAVIVCPTAVIGPHDFRISHMGQLVIDYCKGKIKFTIDGAYDFVDVRDVCEGHMLAAERGLKGNSYLLSGYSITLDELMNLLSEITGIPRPKFKIPVNIARIAASFMPVYYKITGIKPKFTLYSINTVRSNSNIGHTKATKELGYNPRPLEESLRDTIKWFYKKGYV